MTPSAFYQAQVPMGGLATTFSMSGNSQSFAFGHSSGSLFSITLISIDLINYLFLFRVHTSIQQGRERVFQSLLRADLFC